MGNGDRQSASSHAGKEQRLRFEQFDLRPARFELLAAIAAECRPVFGAGHDVLERREHLATIADTEREAFGIREKLLEFAATALIEQDGLRTALPCAEHVAIREAATGGEAGEVGEPDATFEHIADRKSTRLNSSH